jgi:endonuclease YncB( thermonuclease family)
MFSKNFSLLVFLFFLSACSDTSNTTEINLNDYVWNDTEILEKKNSSIVEDEAEFFFAVESFPDKCRWEILRRVVDGDTVIVGNNERVRFIGIDTPETKHPRKPLDRQGLVASAYLKDLVAQTKKICLIQDTIGDELDKYDRTLAYLFTEDGVDLNAELLHSGWAKGYFYFAFDRKAEFRKYEAIAKNQKIGVWE